MQDLAKEREDLAWKMHKLQVATKNKNSDAVRSSFNNKVMSDLSENKIKQIDTLRAQVDRLKETAEASKRGYSRPSNCSKPAPI